LNYSGYRAALSSDPSNEIVVATSVADKLLGLFQTSVNRGGLEVILPDGNKYFSLFLVRGI
jgi:hypothetical protein